MTLILFCIVTPALAQQQKAMTYKQQIEHQKSALIEYTPIPITTFRLSADVDFGSASPSILNDHRSHVLWNGTTPTSGTFSGLSGFNVGVGFYVNESVFGLSFSRISNELENTSIPATATSVQDGFELEQIALTYDYIIQEIPEYSFEIGGSVGYATKFRFYNSLNNNGTIEAISWIDNPLIIKFKGSYCYHFSKHVRSRLGIGYEIASSSNLKSEDTHVAQNISQGQSLQNANGNNLLVDFSGVRANIGLIVSF
jgi:hypothetical protein